MIDLLVIPGAEFWATYAGTRYLLSRLAELGLEFDVFHRIDPKNEAHYQSMPFRIDFYKWWNPSWPKWKRRVSVILFRLRIILRLMRARKVLLMDSMYLPEVALVKCLRPKMLVVQFCQELSVLRDSPNDLNCRFYNTRAKVADYVVDVDPFRAQKRYEYFDLDRLPEVLRNTCPKSVAFSRPEGKTLVELAGMYEFPKGLPIVVYAGGIGHEKPFERLIRAVQMQNGNCFFLAFCVAGAAAVSTARSLADKSLKSGTYCICSGIGHDVLMNALHDADIGIVDYPYRHDKTWNQLYCAPTKLYEYLACGLAVVGSANDSLKDVVEANGAGVCALDDEDDSLGVALTKVLMDYREMKLHAKETFLNKYTYEMCCWPIVDKIHGWLKKEV